MSASTPWKPLAIVALAGWAGTAWWLWPAPQTAPLHTPTSPPVTGSAGVAPSPAPSSAPRGRPAPATAPSEAVAPGALGREEALELARQELADEQQARRERFHEDRLNDGLEHIAQFVEDERLSVTQHEQLDAAMLAHHERMGAVFRDMDGPPGPEVRSAMHDARERFTDEVATIVGDDLAEDFFGDRSGPGGPGGFGRGPRDR